MFLHKLFVLRFLSVLELLHDSVEVDDILLNPDDALMFPQHSVDHASDHA